MCVAPSSSICTTVPSTPATAPSGGSRSFDAPDAVEMAEQLVGAVDQVDDHLIYDICYHT